MNIFSAKLKRFWMAVDLKCAGESSFILVEPHALQAAPGLGKPKPANCHQIRIIFWLGITWYNLQVLPAVSHFSASTSTWVTWWLNFS